MKKLRFSAFPPLSYAGSEAINTLCTNLTFSGNGIKKIMISSCHASEGKTTITMNVLRTMAKLGKRVVLVDCDLRRSTIVKHFGVEFESAGEVYGTTHLLAGMATEEDALYETDIPGAYIVPVIKTVRNSLSLLNSDRMKQLLDWLAEYFDYVLVDAPPIGALIDAAQIARYCDGTLLVVNYNAVTKKELADAKTQIEQSGCPILGTVINQAAFDSYLNRKYYYKSYYYNYYYYGYYNSGSGSHRPHGLKALFSRKKK